MEKRWYQTFISTHDPFDNAAAASLGQVHLQGETPWLFTSLRGLVYGNGCTKPWLRSPSFLTFRSRQFDFPHGKLEIAQSQSFTNRMAGGLVSSSPSPGTLRPPRDFYSHLKLHSLYLKSPNQVLKRAWELTATRSFKEETVSQARRDGRQALCNFLLLPKMCYGVFPHHRPPPEPL